MMRPPSRIVATLRICGALASMAVALAASPAYALSFECIEASRYRHLMRIFGEDPEALLTYFHLPRSLRPPPDACRAMTVTGTLAKGDGKKLLAEIVQSQGWLASLYLAHSGTNRDEEVKIATIIRTFWLKTLHFGNGPQLYEPDFIVRSAETGPSVTAAWQPNTATKHSLSAGRDDYLLTVQRKLPDSIGKENCTESCVSFLLAGMERQASNPGAAPSQPTRRADADQRTRTALQLWLDDTTFGGGASALPAPPTLADVSRVPRAAKQALREECGLEIDASLGAQEQVKNAVEGLAKMEFDRFVRVEKLMPRFDAMRATIGRLQACIAGTYERKRAAAMQQYCGAKCELTVLDATFTERAGKLIASWE